MSLKDILRNNKDCDIILNKELMEQADMEDVFTMMIMQYKSICNFELDQEFINTLIDKRKLTIPNYISNKDEFVMMIYYLTEHNGFYTIYYDDQCIYQDWKRLIPCQDYSDIFEDFGLQYTKIVDQLYFIIVFLGIKSTKPMDAIKNHLYNKSKSARKV